MQRPSIGRIVVYRSRTGDYDVPAIVNCTTEKGLAQARQTQPESEVD